MNNGTELQKIDCNNNKNSDPNADIDHLLRNMGPQFTQYILEKKHYYAKKNLTHFFNKVLRYLCTLPYNYKNDINTIGLTLKQVVMMVLSNMNQEYQHLFTNNQYFMNQLFTMV